MKVYLIKPLQCEQSQGTYPYRELSSMLDVVSFCDYCLFCRFVKHQNFSISSYPVSHQADMRDAWLVRLITIKLYHPITECSDLKKTGNMRMAFKQYDSPSFLVIFIGKVTCKRWKRAEKGVRYQWYGIEKMFTRVDIYASFKNGCGTHPVGTLLEENFHIFCNYFFKLLNSPTLN